jgi:hypothetical protein
MARPARPVTATIRSCGNGEDPSAGSGVVTLIRCWIVAQTSARNQRGKDGAKRRLGFSRQHYDPFSYGNDLR